MSSQALPIIKRRPYSFGPFYDFLMHHFPEHRSQQNVFDVPGFAAEMGYAHETIYKAIRQREPLKIGVALNILKLSRTASGAKPIYWEDLISFILPDYDEYRREGPALDSDISNLLD